MLGKDPVFASLPADVNSSAVFLKKYMELDDRDRFAIGHRFAKKLGIVYLRIAIMSALMIL